MTTIKPYLKNLHKCDLFSNIEQDEILASLNKINYSVQSFNNSEMIALEGEECNTVGIILKGTVEIKKIYASGKSVVLTRLPTSDTFGEVVIFSTAKDYPASLFAKNNTQILFISKEDVIQLCSNNIIFMENFMKILSDKTLKLSSRIKALSLDTIRQKIAHYLLEQYKKQGSRRIKLPISKKNLAEDMGVRRPSLSRELGKMRNEGLIDFHQDIIEIEELQKIEEILLN